MRCAVVLIVLVLLSGCTSQTSPKTTVSYEQVKLLTKDGFEIAGTYHQGERGGVLLLHGLGETRKVWKSFADQLAQDKWSVLAIDMRGHGQSVYQYGELKKWQQFEAEDFLAGAKDIQAAQDFLEARNRKGIRIIGASIGANLGIRYAAGTPIVKMIALSPGLDYRGVTVSEAIPFIKGELYLMASEEDTYSAQTVRMISDRFHGQGKAKMYVNAGHGTTLLEGTDAADTILGWLS